MRLLLTLVVAFCLVSATITVPLPAENEAATTENAKNEEAAQTTVQPAGDADSSEEEESEESSEETDEKKTEDEDKSQVAGKENPDEKEGEGEGETEVTGIEKPDEKEGEGEGESEVTGIEKPDKKKGKGEGKKNSPKSKDGKGEGKNNPIETYNKVIELLDKTTKIDKVDSSHLRAGLNGDLQTYLRNPIVDVIGRVGDFSKISSCFKSMGADVKKILQEVLKSFKSCKGKKDSTEYNCAADRSSAQGQIAKIASAISSCVVSKRS